MIPFPKPQLIHLGAPPWNEDTLARALFANREAVDKALDDHPGRELNDRLESLASVRRLFNKTAVSIQDCITLFDVQSREGSLLQRSRKDDLKAIEEQLQEALYIFAAASMTLVDQSRTLTVKIKIPGYAERVASTFSNSPKHRFVQELRVDMVHFAGRHSRQT